MVDCRVRVGLWLQKKREGISLRQLLQGPSTSHPAKEWPFRLRPLCQISYRSQLGEIF